jgi:cell wall assembly regulator SMI1
MVTGLIDRMGRWLKTHRPDYYARLLPGVTGTQLDEFEARFGLKLPAAFRMLYEWRNGQEALCSASLYHNLMFSSLEDIAHIKELMDGMIGFDFEDPRWWRRSWVPFLENGGGDHLCLDLAAEDGGTPGQVLTFWHDDPDRPVRFPSFETWLVDLVESMESGSLELA